MEDLNDNNWLIFAAKAYSRPNVVQSEFDEDINRILYIKRLISKYYITGTLKERLILNHIIIFCNVFGIKTATRLLFLKLEEKDWSVIKPFLLLIDSLPETIESVRGRTICTADIVLDDKVIAALRAL